MTDAPALVVEAFLYAVMRDKNFDAAGELLADDVVYENVGYPTMRGAERILKTFRRAAARLPFINWDVKFHRIASEGAVVLNERTDSIIVGRFQAHFWVCGVFEVHNGRITLWRDYFDVLDMIQGTIRGLAAMAIPSLRHRPKR
jgi:limonene-1,2-epoxide hydrolase